MVGSHVGGIQAHILPGPGQHGPREDSDLVSVPRELRELVAVRE